VNGSVYPVALKGRAWIKADSFQIVRMESELVSPAPEIHLATEHQIVDYGPVAFKKKKEDLWLPHSAELYFNFRNRRYYRRDSFDHFMLFAVDSAEKRNELKPQSNRRRRRPRLPTELLRSEFFHHRDLETQSNSEEKSLWLCVFLPSR